MQMTKLLRFYKIILEIVFMNSVKEETLEVSIWKNFLNRIQKTLSRKVNVDKRDYIEIWKLFSLMESIKEWKDKPRN